MHIWLAYKEGEQKYFYIVERVFKFLESYRDRLKQVQPFLETDFELGSKSHCELVSKIKRSSLNLSINITVKEGIEAGPYHVTNKLGI